MKEIRTVSRFHEAMNELQRVARGLIRHDRDLLLHISGVMASMDREVIKHVLDNMPLCEPTEPPKLPTDDLDGEREPNLMGNELERFFLVRPGLTREDFCEVAGISVATLRHCINQTRVVSYSTEIKILRAMMRYRHRRPNTPRV